jgi:hypothetical protein
MANLTEQPIPLAVERPSRRQQRWLGGATLVVTGFLIALEGVAIGTASVGDPVTATTLAWAVIVLMIATLVVGFTAIILNRGRRPAIVAVVIGVLGNPLVATWLLAALDSR